MADQGSFTAAAEHLGYSQSAVSRQVAGAEREFGHQLFERSAGGARLTAAGRIVLSRAAVALDELAAAEQELAGTSTGRLLVRLGVFISAGPALMPTVLASIHRRHRDRMEVRTREGSTPALIRAVRAHSVDLALVTSRPPHHPPDTEAPALRVDVIGDVELLVAVPANSGLASASSLSLQALSTQRWIASASTTAEPLLGVWPGLPGRAVVAHQVRDWMTKLQLVAAGEGVTTVPSHLLAHLPEGVVPLTVGDGPAEIRRMQLIHRPDTEPVWAVNDLAAELRAALRDASHRPPTTR